MEEKLAYKVCEFAMLIGCSEQIVRRWLREGKIKGTKMGSKNHHWYIPKQELDRVLVLYKARGEL